MQDGIDKWLALAPGCQVFAALLLVSGAVIWKLWKLLALKEEALHASELSRLEDYKVMAQNTQESAVALATAVGQVGRLDRS